MKKLYSIAIISLFLHLAFSSIAQDSTENVLPKKSYLKAVISYQNDNVYQGRKDSVQLPYVTPSLGFYFGSGFFVSGSFSYLTLSGENRIDASELDAGWSYNKNKWDGEFSVSKFFYSSLSTSVKSEVSASLNGSTGYDFGFIKPVISGTMNIGSKVDIASSVTLQHSFSLAEDRLNITPTLTANASTQNYYDSYYQKRRFKRGGKGKAPSETLITGTAQNVKNFKIMDWEYGLPVEYNLNKFTFTVTPVYSIPVNPNVIVITVKPQNGPAVIKTITEKLSNCFFWQFEISFNF